MCSYEKDTRSALMGLPLAKFGIIWTSKRIKRVTDYKLNFKGNSRDHSNIKERKKERGGGRAEKHTHAEWRRERQRKRDRGRERRNKKGKFIFTEEC